MRIIVLALGVTCLVGGAAHADRVAHVFAKGRGPASAVETTQVGGITRTDQTRGQVGRGPNSSLVKLDGKFLGRDFHQRIGSSTIGKVLRTEMETKVAGRGTATVSTVENIGSRPGKLTVWKSDSHLGMFGMRGEAVVEQRGDKVRVVRNEKSFTLFGKKLFSIGREKSAKEIADYTK